MFDSSYKKSLYLFISKPPRYCISWRQTGLSSFRSPSGHVDAGLSLESVALSCPAGTVCLRNRSCPCFPDSMLYHCRKPWRALKPPERLLKPPPEGDTCFQEVRKGWKKGEESGEPGKCVKESSGQHSVRKQTKTKLLQENVKVIILFIVHHYMWFRPW